MSFFSRSSKGNHYKHGNHGSGYYQKKGILGNLMDMLGSRSNSKGHYNNYNQPYPPQQGYPQGQQGYQQPPYPQGQQGYTPIQQDGIACGSCGSKVPAGSKFCLNCGEPMKMELFCQNCGEKLPPNAKFCNRCGNKLNG